MQGAATVQACPPIVPDVAVVTLHAPPVPLRETETLLIVKPSGATMIRAPLSVLPPDAPAARLRERPRIAHHVVLGNISRRERGRPGESVFELRVGEYSVTKSEDVDEMVPEIAGTLWSW